MASPPVIQPYVQDLIDDALNLARYGRYSGKFRTTKLYQDVTRILHERPLSPALVTELQETLSDTTQELPYETFAALKRGWCPSHRQSSGARRKTIGLVAFSMLLMILTATLTLTHNVGVDLSYQLDNLLEENPDAEMGRLVREHYLTRQMLSGNIKEMNRNNVSTSTSANTTTSIYEDLVPLASLEALQSELASLSGRTEALSSEVLNFVDVRANYPIPGLAVSACFISNIRTPPNSPGEDFHPFWSCIIQKQEDLEEGHSMDETQIHECFEEELKSNSDDHSGTLGQWNRIMNDEIDGLVCDGTFAALPTTSDLELQNRLAKLNYMVGLYTLWILPAVYGAMGAVMYHMRWVLNPLLPFPSMTRLLHRIVLSALVGVILGWVYAPNSAIADSVGSVGFSLFVVAFLFGFSLDAFFSLIDRLITFSQANVFGNFSEIQTAEYSPPNRDTEAAQEGDTIKSDPTKP